MKTFLNKVVVDIVSTHESLVDVICVLPTERAGVFLKKEFVNEIHKTTFLPQIISIESFIEKMSGLSSIDQINLLFEFYEVYLQSNDSNKESFDCFVQWAKTALQDFNEIDRHLVNAEKLFSYLKDVKRLEEWNVTENSSTEIVNNHLHFMENLGRYYGNLKAYLLSKNVGYQGLQYRKATENVDRFIQENKSQKIVFIGFNALNKAEELIFKKLLDINMAKVFWDADSYYMNSNNQAGYFLRSYKDNWEYYQKNTFSFIEDHFNNEKSITVIPTPKNVTQIKTVANLLKAQNELENTALVLADESLLSLTLNSLPANVNSLNITMGYPLKNMPITGFFEALFQLYINQDKLNKVQENAFYYKDVFRLFSHSFFRVLTGQSFYELKADLEKQNLIFIPQQTLHNLFIEHKISCVFESCFSISHSVTKFLSTSLELLFQSKDNFTGFEKECVYRFHNLFLQIQNLNEKYKHINSLKTLHQLFNQLIVIENLSFQGEPLSGLQLMGMLETRVLDFETIILTSVNEGVLPSAKNENTFIPFDIKVAYEMPTYLEKDAIFAYHFYRLLQRSKQVYLLYNSETDDFGAGEKSRFITQLELDTKAIQFKTVDLKLNQISTEPIEIPKNEAVFEKLKSIAERGFSPSALSTYVMNPLTYYKRYILNISDVEEVEETIAANTLGSIIHDVLETLYKPYCGAYLKILDIQNMLLSVTDLTEQNFKKYYINGDFSTGKNKLIFEVAQNFVRNFLELEKEELIEGRQIKILETEKKYKVEIPIKKYDFPINISGTIDRVDEVDGVLRIVDYKTGKVESKDLQIDYFEKVLEDYKYTKGLQVLLYTYLYASKNPFIFELPLEAGIYSFKNMQSKFLKVNFAEGRKTDYTINKSRINDFLLIIERLISEILDVNKPFKENTDSAY